MLKQFWIAVVILVPILISFIVKQKETPLLPEPKNSSNHRQFTHLYRKYLRLCQQEKPLFLNHSWPLTPAWTTNSSACSRICKKVMLLPNFKNLGRNVNTTQRHKGVQVVKGHYKGRSASWSKVQKNMPSPLNGFSMKMKLAEMAMSKSILAKRWKLN